MAKESMKAREVKRQKLVAKYAARKAELKKLAKSEDYDVAYEANRALQNLPKNASSVRLHNRCQLTGRPKGYIRQFGISRIQFREMANWQQISNFSLNIFSFPYFSVSSSITANASRGRFRRRSIRILW